VVHFHNVSLVGGPGVLKMSRAPVTLYSTHEHWLICPTHVLWKYRSRPCEKPTCLSCTIASGKPPQLWRYTNLVSDALKHVDCLLAPSEFTAQKHRDAGITAPIRVLPFFSPIQPDAGLRTEPPDHPVFVYAGRLEKSKGIESLLETFAERPGDQLIVAGSGSLEYQLRGRFGSLTNIRFLGLVPHLEIRALMSRATAVIVPSWGPEVSPLSVLEALSCGVPTIIRRAGGSAEVVEAGGGGWVYDHPDELPLLLDHIAAHPEQVKEMGLTARHNAEKNLGIEAWMKRYFELIEQIRSGAKIRS
jgi:glycosyltransferase involved in cell wall biosynthesis